jgi:biopolymer transport protein TolQ
MAIAFALSASTPMLQAGAAVPTTYLQMVLHADPVTQGVLIVLAILSIVSWAIMFSLGRQMKKATGLAREFSADFDRTLNLDEGAALARRAKPNALSRILLQAMHFVSGVRGGSLQMRERESGAVMAPAAATLSGSQIETLYLLLDAEAAGERERLGRFIPWLATIASASPLIGLLGTVLGIIESFIGIAQKGSGNLAAVAPGVGQALTATALALAVAIPATFGYNLFANRLNRYEGQMEQFGTNVIARLVREGHI